MDENGEIIYSYVREKKNKEEENMKKIKVGDRVKIVDTKGEMESYKKLLGHTYTVEAIVIADDTGYECVSLAGTSYAPYLFNCELVDENVKQFKKSDLKLGDVVTFRNGLVATVDKENTALFFKNGNRVISIYGYNENLTSKNGYNWDIIKLKD